MPADMKQFMALKAILGFPRPGYYLEAQERYIIRGIKWYAAILVREMGGRERDLEHQDKESELAVSRREMLSNRTHGLFGVKYAGHRPTNRFETATSIETKTVEGATARMSSAGNTERPEGATTSKHSAENPEEVESATATMQAAENTAEPKATASMVELEAESDEFSKIMKATAEVLRVMRDERRTSTSPTTPQNTNTATESDERASMKPKSIAQKLRDRDQIMMEMVEFLVELKDHLEDLAKKPDPPELYMQQTIAHWRAMHDEGFKRKKGVHWAKRFQHEVQTDLDDLKADQEEYEKQRERIWRQACDCGSFPCCATVCDLREHEKVLCTCNLWPLCEVTCKLWKLNYDIQKAAGDEIDRKLQNARRRSREQEQGHMDSSLLADLGRIRLGRQAVSEQNILDELEQLVRDTRNLAGK